MFITDIFYFFIAAEIYMTWLIALRLQFDAAKQSFGVEYFQAGDAILRVGYPIFPFIHTDVADLIGFAKTVWWEITILIVINCIGWHSCWLLPTVDSFDDIIIIWGEPNQHFFEW